MVRPDAHDRPDLRPSALSGIAGRGRSPHRRPFAHSAPKAVSFHRRGSAERQVGRARQGSRAVASRLRPGASTGSASSARADRRKRDSRHSGSGGGAVPSPDPTRDGGGLTRSEEHTSELQSLMRSSYAVFCLTKKKRQTRNKTITTYR